MKRIVCLIIFMTMGISAISYAQEFSPETTEVGFMKKQTDDMVTISMYEADEEGFMILKNEEYLSEIVFTGGDYYGFPTFRIIARRLSPEMVYVETLRAIETVDNYNMFCSYSIYEIEDDGFKLQMSVNGDEYAGSAVYTDLRNTDSEDSREFDINADRLNEFFKDYELEFQDGENLLLNATGERVNCTLSSNGGEVILDKANNYDSFPDPGYLHYQATHRDE